MTRRHNAVDFIGADPLSTADRLEALAADLRRLASGSFPAAADLSDAPVLREWGVMSRSCFALVGTVEGHPRIPDFRPAMTSEVFAIDKGKNWARTLNRYYRLEPRRSEGKQHG